MRDCLPPVRPDRRGLAGLRVHRPEVPFDGGGLHAFGEVVADETRIRADNVLSFPYQEKSAGPAPSAPHAAGFALPA